MGNGVSSCFSAAPTPHFRRHSPHPKRPSCFFAPPPWPSSATGGGGGGAAADEDLGHSFCYVRPPSLRHDSSSDLDTSAEYTSISTSSSNDSCCSPIPFPADYSCSGDLSSAAKTTFRTISGASVSANAASAPCCVYIQHQKQVRSNAGFRHHRRSASISSGGGGGDGDGDGEFRAAAFECTECFNSLPLQPAPLAPPSSIYAIADQKGFLSGPLERINYSGPFFDAASFSAPLPNYVKKRLPTKVSGLLTTVFGKVPAPSSLVATPSPTPHRRRRSRQMGGGLPPSPSPKAASPDLDADLEEKKPVQWARCKAGEDRVHVVLSDEHGWLFVGIYDGFNGPDAPDFLMCNLYANIYKELEGVLWGDDSNATATAAITAAAAATTATAIAAAAAATASTTTHHEGALNSAPIDSQPPEQTNPAGMEPLSAADAGSGKRGDDQGTKRSSAPPLRRMTFPSSRDYYSKSRPHLKKKGTHVSSSTTSRSEDEKAGGGGGGGEQEAVLKALARALERTEAAFMKMGEAAMAENPEIALMGSCVLVMLMKGEDVYVMNVGDSRAIVGRRAAAGRRRWRKAAAAAAEGGGAESRDVGGVEGLECIEEDGCDENGRCRSAVEDVGEGGPLDAVQLSWDHSTSVLSEVERIKEEHGDDLEAIVNGRVKGTLKVTRAFGAGFLKRATWNEGLLEMLRVEYVGDKEYLNCRPWLHHERLHTATDQFLILSSDGLFQYLSNHEAVSQVHFFLNTFPDGDPAQHLLELLLFRAAHKAGMNFHELLDIPQGDRRKYHDDVSVMVISLQGRIWKCSSN